VAEISVRFAMPAPRLQPYVSTYWELTVTGDGMIEDLLPPEWANIRLTFDCPWEFGSERSQLTRLQDAAIIQGPTSRATWVRGPASTNFGIGILPTGWNRIWKTDASLFADNIQPLTALVGAEKAMHFYATLAGCTTLEARAAHCDAMLLSDLDAAPKSAFDDQVLQLFRILTDPNIASVEQITATLGITQSRLARLSKRAFGFPPKLLLRRQRFLRMLGALMARPYSEWSDFLDPQYVDQSHMIRDFNHFIGKSPGRYMSGHRPILTAAAKGRAAMFGQPLQGLHPARETGA
jgi:methylphosphotriester-DNA--protein-cysteine methyltransferase